MGANLIDIAVGIVLFISIFFAVRRGFILTISGITALILAVLTSYTAHAPTKQLLIEYRIIEQLYAGDISDAFLSTASYFIIFPVTYLLVLFSFKLISALIHKLDLGFVDRILGFIYGFVRALIILMIFILPAQYIPSLTNSEAWQSSLTIPYFKVLLHNKLGINLTALTAIVDDDEIESSNILSAKNKEPIDINKIPGLSKVMDKLNAHDSEEIFAHLSTLDSAQSSNKTTLSANETLQLLNQFKQQAEINADKDLTADEVINIIQQFKQEHLNQPAQTAQTEKIEEEEEEEEEVSN